MFLEPGTKLRPEDLLFGRGAQIHAAPSMAQRLRYVTPVSGNAIDSRPVDFDLSGDQEAFRDTAGDLLDRYADHDALRARVGEGVVVGTLPGAAAPAEAAGAPSAPSGYDASVWAAMADQGWLALELAEDDGGLGLGMVEVAVLCEQIGRRLVAAPYSRACWRSVPSPNPGPEASMPRKHRTTR